MARAHPGDYRLQRMGVVRQDWNCCDKTPCRCGPKARRLAKKRMRAWMRADARKQAAEHFANDGKVTVRFGKYIIRVKGRGDERAEREE